MGANAASDRCSTDNRFTLQQDRPPAYHAKGWRLAAASGNVAVAV